VWRCDGCYEVVLTFFDLVTIGARLTKEDDAPSDDFEVDNEPVQPMISLRESFKLVVLIYDFIILLNNRPGISQQRKQTS
jgi:hypothetical protein